jgi:predicted TIM-barrel fold metal-dependent hydrolase
MTIDVHTHYVPAALADALRQRTEPPCIEPEPGGGERFVMPIGSLAFTPAFVDMDQRLDFMDDHGVDVQLLSFPGLFGLDSLPADEAEPLLRLFNDDLATLCARHPGRFAGLAALPIADMDLAIAELRRGMESLGLAGAILPVNGFVTEDHAAAFAPLFEAADALGAHLFVHPGRRPDEVPPPGAPVPPAPDQAIARRALEVQHRVAHAMVTLLFTDFLDPYASVSVHVANLGGTLPMVIERMDHVVETRAPEMPLFTSRARRLHVDCSSLGSHAIEIAASVFGHDRLLMGTDCPIFRTDWTLRAIAGARLTDAERAAIRHDNAARLLARFLDR